MRLQTAQASARRKWLATLPMAAGRFERTAVDACDPTHDAGNKSDWGKCRVGAGRAKSRCSSSAQPLYRGMLDRHEARTRMIPARRNRRTKPVSWDSRAAPTACAHDRSNRTRSLSARRQHRAPFRMYAGVLKSSCDARLLASGRDRT